jgi:hypothetical protein
MNGNSNKAAYNPGAIADITASLKKARDGSTLPEVFEGLDGPAIRRCLIALGVIKPGTLDDPTPQRFLEEGAALRRRVYDPKGRTSASAGYTGQKEVWRAPPTLRVDHWGRREARRVIARDNGQPS